MNIEIANRLVDLRKKNQLSQEELAGRLGVSRQAVSKWERAESSPDTDNLICLAKIYNVSLDELLQNDASVEDIVDNEIAKEPIDKQIKGKNVHIGNEGIHVVDQDQEVIISKTGIYAKDGKHSVRIRTHGSRDGNPLIERKYKLAKEITTGIVALICVIVYILIGSLSNIWHPTWIIFFAIPIVESFVNVVAYRRFSKLSYPIIVSAIYLILGFLIDGWHPWWLLFVTIPIFYMVVKPIETYYLKDKEVIIDGETINLSEFGANKDEE